MIGNQKLIVITGVTKGLGRALVNRFHENTCVIAGCGRTSEEIKELQSHYPNDLYETVDVSDSMCVQKWAHTILAKGTPDLIINNASIANHPAPLWEIPIDEFKAVVNINIIGFWNVIRAFVPAMIKQNQGVIVNTSSGWGQYGAALFGPYCASKFAVEGMTQSLAEELPSTMAAVAISPGMIDTEMLRTCVPDSAHLAPKPEEWSKQAVPFLLQLGPKDNGKSLQVPHK